MHLSSLAPAPSAPQAHATVKSHFPFPPNTQHPPRSFFDQISQDTGKFVFGVKDTLACLEMGAVETLIVWENLEVQRYVFTHPATGVQDTKYLAKEQEGEAKHFKDPATNQDLDVTDKVGPPGGWGRGVGETLSWTVRAADWMCCRLVQPKSMGGGGAFLHSRPTPRPPARSNPCWSGWPTTTRSLAARSSS